MNDTVLNNDHLAVIISTMKHGMLATVHTFDEELIKETCARINFDYAKWYEENMEIPGIDDVDGDIRI